MAYTETPLPEAEAYRVQIKEKQKRERAARKFTPDLTKYDITINGKTQERLAKRWAIFAVVKHLCDQGIEPKEIQDAIPWRRNRLFEVAEGELDSESYIASVTDRRQQEGKRFDARRFNCGDDDLIHSGGKTYAFSNQWGLKTVEAITNLTESFPDANITCEPSS